MLKDTRGQALVESALLAPLFFILDEQRRNVNRAARNMAENVANAARSGPTIFSVSWAMLHKAERDCTGYGSNEKGENIMKRIANVKGVDTYNPNQPTGMYAYAEDSTQIDAAFNQVARSILRLSK